MREPRVHPFEEVDEGMMLAALGRHPALIAWPAALGAGAALAYTVLADGSPRNVLVGLLGGLIVGALLALAAAWGPRGDG